MHGQTYWQVERVVSGLVGHNCLVLFHVESGDIAAGCLQILKLTDGCDESNFMEKIDDLVVIFFVAKVFLQQEVDSVLDHHRVVDAAKSNIVNLVPTLVATTSLAAVHHIIGH